MFNPESLFYDCTSRDPIITNTKQQTVHTASAAALLIVKRILAQESSQVTFPTSILTADFPSVEDIVATLTLYLGQNGLQSNWFGDQDFNLRTVL